MNGMRNLRPLSLRERLLLSSTALLVLILVLLVATPITISAPIRIGELAILVAAFFGILALNAAYLGRALAPLNRFAERLREVDLSRPQRLEAEASDRTPELTGFIDSFNEMLERLRAERRARSRAVLLAEERQRRRIALSLHDGTGQTLTAVALEIERMAAGEVPDQQERLSTLSTELYAALEEVRRISRELRPGELDDLGLANALIALSSRLSRAGSPAIERRLDAQLPPLSEEVELAVYRIAQEALTNVLRHSRAQRCLLALEADEGNLRLAVVDDGVGLPTEPGDSIGLEGMRERALLIDARLTLGPGPAGGTAVRLEVPLEGP